MARISVSELRAHKTKKEAKVKCQHCGHAHDKSDGWESALTRNNQGVLHGSVANIVKILQHDPAWQGVIGWDEFALKITKLKPPPFLITETGEWVGTDDSKTSIWLSDTYNFRPSTNIIGEAVNVVAEYCAFHPVKNYLNALEWDGRPRLRTWLIQYLGAPDSPSTRLVGVCWLIGAVARIQEPGCKMDNVLMLEGDQGIGKSKALSILGGEWFTDTPFDLGSKDGFLAMRGHWIVELAELDTFNRAESTRAKQFFASRSDTYREPYGRRTRDIPRQCVFAGSTNSDEYLRDETGNRRYWPVLVRKVEDEKLNRDRDQLWAEAVHLYNSGEKWWTEPGLDYIKTEQDKRYTTDAWESKISAWIADQQREYNHRYPPSPLPFYVTVADVLGYCLEIPPGKWGKPEQMRVASILKRLGMIRKQFPVRDNPEKKTEWGYGYRFSKDE